VKPLLALFAVLALACAAPDEATPPAPAPPPPPPSADEGFAGLKKRGVLRVAADPKAPPFLSVAPDGSREGFEWAIMQAIGDAAGVPVAIVESTFDALPEALSSREADLAIGQMSPSAAYGDLAFSVSYLQYSLCLVVPAKSSVTSLAELRGKRVAMYDDPVARQLADVLVGASYQRVVVEDYGYFEQMVRGQLDAMVYDCPLARYEMDTFGDKLRVADGALNVATYNVAARKGDTKLLEDVNRVLAELGNKGLLAALEKRWLKSDAAAQDFDTATGRVVVVKRGESLSQIAARELGSADRWKEIYAANEDVVGPDANVVYAGMRLRLAKK
jgi:polar amino acid transport system substrate-binding protein